MKKIFLLIFMISACTFTLRAQSNHLVINTASGVKYDYAVSTIDSMRFIDVNNIPFQADTLIEVSVNLAPTDGYDYTTFALPVKKFYKFFGYSRMADCMADIYSNTVKFYFYNATSRDIYSVDHTKGTANSGGCWFGANGDVTNWGVNSYFYIEPNIKATQIAFNLGQYPEVLKEGETYTLYMGLQNGKKYVAFKITVNVTSKNNNEQQSLSYNTWLPINEAGYDQVRYEIDTTGICSGFGMTLEELNSAIGVYDLNFYPVDPDGNIDKSGALLDVDGYWYKADGTPCAAIDAGAVLKIDPTYDGLSVFFSQAPYACKVGDMFELKYAISSENIDIIFTFDITIQKQGYHPTGYTSDGHNNFVVYQDITNTYEALPVKLDTLAIAADLGYANAQEVIAAMSTGDVKLVNLNADLSEGTATANNGGAWYDASGNTCSWGATARVASEPPAQNFTNGEMIFNLSMYPGVIKSGEVYEMNKKLATKTKETFIKFVVNIK